MRTRCGCDPGVVRVWSGCGPGLVRVWSGPRSPGRLTMALWKPDQLKMGTSASQIQTSLKISSLAAPKTSPLGVDGRAGWGPAASTPPAIWTRAPLEQQGTTPHGRPTDAHGRPRTSDGHPLAPKRCNWYERYKPYNRFSGSTESVTARRARATQASAQI